MTPHEEATALVRAWALWWGKDPEHPHQQNLVTSIAIALEDADDALANLRERCAVIAETPTGHYQIGTGKMPYWNGEKIAAAIRALPL